MTSGGAGNDGHALAARVGAVLQMRDRVFGRLEMRLEAITPGHARIGMRVAPWMINGHDLCHGGLIFTLADSALAYASNAGNRSTVAQQCSISFVAPARAGDYLVAEARERASTGRSGIYDVDVRGQDGRIIALFRGQARVTGAAVAPEDESSDRGEG